MHELVEDVLVPGGLRKRRWVADEEFAGVEWCPAPLASPHLENHEMGGNVEIVEDKDLGMWSMTVMYPFRGPVEFHFGRPIHPDKDRKDDFIRMLAWAIQKDKVSKCMMEGAEAFARMVGRRPKVAYIKTLPPKAEHGVEVADVMLLEVSWAVEGFLFIGG